MQLILISKMKSKLIMLKKTLLSFNKLRLNQKEAIKKERDLRVQKKEEEIH